MQQTADVEILWITVDVAAECLPAYGSFFSSAAVADGDAMATDVDVEMTAACGSSFFSAAVVVSATDAAMAVDAVTMTTAGSSWFCFFFAATTALAAVTAAEDVDADPAPFNKLQSADKKQRIISSAFVCFFLPVALFLSAYFPFYA